MGNDKKIWEDFKNGDSNALSRIFDQQVDFLFRYGCKFTPDKELIKDTIQDLFFDLIRTRKNLGDTDNIRFYLTKSFRRKLIRKVNNGKKLDVHVENIELQAKIIYSVEEELIGREDISEREQKVRLALKEISPKQREILFYRFNCEFEYDQICEIMSLKYDSARKQVFRALNALKDKLPDKGGFLFFLVAKF